MEEDDFEARRLANIAANTALLESLGLSPEKRTPSASASPRKRKLLPQPAVSPRTPLARRASARAASDSPAVSSAGLRRSLRERRTPNRGDEPASAALTPKRRRGVKAEPGDDASFIEDDDETADGRQRKAQRLGQRIHDPKTFGAIPGIPVGKVWASRMDCSTDAVHAPPVAGIAGSAEQGCFSIVLSGGQAGSYADDADIGESFTYTGSGGCLLRGTSAQPKNLRTAPQTFDQTFSDVPNAALKRSAETKKPVRVVRGYRNPTKWAPVEGYVYSGLYRVERAWMATGLSGFKICRYALKRIRGQAPLPVFEDKEILLLEA